jgi:hypothetical protein
VRYDASVARTVRSVLIAAFLGHATITAVEQITPRLIEEAVSLGQSRIESVRARYHQPYRQQISRPPVDYIDVVTPFRQVVLTTEQRTLLGMRGFTQREAALALGDRADVIELRVELTFHPQNVFVGVPAYEVAIAPAPPAERIPPTRVERIPRFGARIDAAALPGRPGTPPTPADGGQPVTGGTLIAAFPLARLNPRGRYEIVVGEAGKELAKTRVDFAVLR